MKPKHFLWHTVNMFLCKVSGSQGIDLLLKPAPVDIQGIAGLGIFGLASWLKALESKINVYTSITSWLLLDCIMGAFHFRSTWLKLNVHQFSMREQKGVARHQYMLNFTITRRKKKGKKKNWTEMMTVFILIWHSKFSHAPLFIAPPLLIKLA